MTNGFTCNVTVFVAPMDKIAIEQNIPRTVRRGKCMKHGYTRHQNVVLGSFGIVMVGAIRVLPSILDSKLDFWLSVT